MADLTEPQKHRIVLALACFEGPADIARELVAEGVETDRVQVGRYDPTKPYYEAGEKWIPIFTEARQAYLTEVQAVPIANQGYRLRVLQKTLDEAVRTKNKVLANQTLRQAAEEVGGAMTNERNIKVTKPLEEITPDERRTMFEELIRKAMEAKDPPGTAPAPAATQ